MDRDSILKTAVTRWDSEDDCFITESHLAPTIVGDGDTERDSFASFIDHVSANYEAYQTGRHALYKKPGRPPKNKVSMHIQVAPDVKEALSAMAQQYSMSQGETVEYLYNLYQKPPTAH